MTRNPFATRLRYNLGSLLRAQQRCPEHAPHCDCSCMQSSGPNSPELLAGGRDARLAGEHRKIAKPFSDPPLAIIFRGRFGIPCQSPCLEVRGNDIRAGQGADSCTSGYSGHLAR
jgi:hypothetical protein